ncbi:MAG: hypothetical protein K2X69_14125 [Silvanigrellaceae bacterium]|nr:hypothetical protein [Silvanigrellaceae bacterium]
MLNDLENETNKLLLSIVLNRSLNQITIIDKIANDIQKLNKELGAK